MKVKLPVLCSRVVRTFTCNLRTICISAGRCVFVTGGYSASLQDHAAWIFIRVGLVGRGGGREVTATSLVLMVARTDRETEREETFMPLVRPAVRKNWDTLIQTSFFLILN